MLARLSLRTRLLLGVLVLAGAVLLAADVATYRSLESFLIQRTDASLQAAHQEVETALTSSAAPGSAQPGTPTPPADGRPRGGNDPASPGRLQNLTRSLPGLFIELRSGANKVLFKGQVAQFARTGSAPPPPRLGAAIPLPAKPTVQGERVRYLTVPASSGGGRYRVRASIEPRLSATDTLIIATSLDGVDSTLHRLLWIELLATGGGLAAILLLGLWVVRLSLRPLAAIGATAASIASGDLSRRVERAEARTEVGRLGLALNAMLSQIESAFKARAASEEGLRKSEARLRRFVADASHELRTPLAAVRAYAELFSRGAKQNPGDLDRAMSGISRESDRMSILVEDLLLLAHLDEGRPLERDRIELEELVFEAAETAHAVEPSRPLRVDIQAQAIVIGDRGRLRQVLDNLLSNVRSHTPPEAPVTVSVTTQAGCALLEVSDTGPGLSADELERIFERFYRADPLRSRDSGGAGLGLAIVAAVAKAHGGEVKARSNPGGGAVFSVLLPLAEALPKPGAPTALTAGQRT